MTYAFLRKWSLPLWAVITLLVATGDALGDEVAASAIVERQAAAWNAGDADAWGADYAEDSVFVNILGMRFESRAENVERHARLFATIFQGSRLEIDVVRLRPVADAVFLLETAMTLRGHVRTPPGISNTEPGILRTRMNYLLAVVEGEWRIVSAQNTAIAPVVTDSENRPRKRADALPQRYPFRSAR